MCAIIWPWEHRKNTPIADRRGASRLAAWMPHPARALRMLFNGRHSRIRRAPLSIVVYSAIRTSSARVNLLME
jgi:hypothetical protein